MPPWAWIYQSDTQEVIEEYRQMEDWAAVVKEPL